MENCLIKEVEEFSARTKKALMQVGILYVEDLSRLHYKDLNMIYSIGEKGKRSIIDFCNKNALRFSEQTFFRTRSFLNDTYHHRSTARETYGNSQKGNEN